MLMLLCATMSFAQASVQGLPREGNVRTEATGSGSKVDFEQIKFWTGNGLNKAALVVKFNDGTSTKAYVWGYRWNGTANGDNMFHAIAKADSRLVSLTQQTNFNGKAAGNGYWSYWITDDTNRDYTSSKLEFSNRRLQDGSVDGWSFVSDMSNWYSADMNNVELVYMQPTSAQVAQVKRKAEESATPTVYTINSPAEINTLLASDDFIEGSTIKFSDDLTGKEVSDNMPDNYCEIEKSVVIDGNGVTLSGGVSFHVYAQNINLTIRNITFKNNTEGYIVYAYDTPSVNIENCTFDNCNAQKMYGLVAINQDAKVPMTFTISGCVFSNSTGNKEGILKIKAYPAKNDEEAAKNPLFTASVTSCTFVNNEGKKDIVGVANRPVARFANNVIEGNKCAEDDAKDLVFKKPTTRVALVGYNVIKGTVNEAVVPTETDVIDADQADNLVQENGEYLVLTTGAAYNHLPANTAIEGITFPEKDITGTAIDYTKATHSGACQKVKGDEPAESDYSKGVFIVNEDWYGHQNSTVNFLTDKGEWVYRVVQKENPGKELGCTNQYGQIYGDRFYLVAKQEKDPGAKVTGGRFTVCDAKTMKVICQLPFIAEKDGKSLADGRGCVGVDEKKVYISTSNGIYIFDTNTLQVTGKVDGADNPYADPSGSGNNSDPGNSSLYKGQVGSMVRVDDYVFAVHQSGGVLVIDPTIDKVKKVFDFTAMIDEFNKYLDDGSKIDPEKKGTWPYPGSAITMSKDGYVWVPVAKGSSGMGSTLPFLVRIDPHSLEAKVVYINPENDIFPPANSWYAWTPDGFCASNVENALYWNGGPNSWFSNTRIFKYDINTGKTTKIIDLETMDDENWKLYGCSLRPDPVTGDLYMSLYHNFGDPTYITRKTDKDGKLIADYSMISDYWFPSLPVFPDNEAPVIAKAIDNISLALDKTATIDLKDLATDADNFNAAIVKSVKSISDESILDAKVENGSLIITPKKEGEATITIKANSNGKLAETSFAVNVTAATGIHDTATEKAEEIARFGADGKRIKTSQKGINIIRMSDGTVRKVLVK